MTDNILDETSWLQQLYVPTFWISAKCKSGTQRASDICQHLLGGLAAMISTTVAFLSEGRNASDLSIGWEGRFQSIPEILKSNISYEFELDELHVQHVFPRTERVFSSCCLQQEGRPDGPDPPLSVSQNPRRDSTSPPPPFTSVSPPPISNRRAPIIKDSCM